MADDSLGAELKNTKLKACVLNWGAACGCPPKDSAITRLGAEAPRQQVTHSGVSGSPGMAQITPCP